MDDWTHLYLVSYCFQFLSFPGQLSLDVTNMPGTAKVLGSNLAETCFFPNGKISASNKTFGRSIVCLSVVGLVATS